MDPIKQRDLAMKRVEDGKAKFNAGPNFEEKEKGYQLYKNGVELLVDYMKSKVLLLRRILNLVYFSHFRGAK